MEWTSRLGRSIKVSLEVSCGPNGWFFLPWPMKARGLTKLDVNGCGIEGFFTEFNVTNRNLVDELKDFSLGHGRKNHPFGPQDTSNDTFIDLPNRDVHERNLLKSKPSSTNNLHFRIRFLLSYGQFLLKYLRELKAFSLNSM
jgi:hypothetical protein